MSVTCRCSTKTANTGSHKQYATIAQGVYFLMPKISAKFDRSHPLRGRQMQAGWVKIGDFRQITGYISTKSSAVTEGPRDASCQLKSCQLSCNSARTTFTTSPEQIEVMKLKGYSGAMCNKYVYSTMRQSSRFHCPIGVINKPTTDELWISPV